MASPFTRSSRRSEGLTTRSGTRSNIATHHLGSNTPQQQQQQPNIGRKKRPHDSADLDDQTITKKKARIAIEITSRPKELHKTRSVVIKATNADLVASPPHQQRLSSPPTPKRNHAETSIEKVPLIETPSPPAKKIVNHHEKVVNGIKHELDRLQPKVADLKEEKRKLRSQEDQWFKSELSAYLPEYDNIIGNIPKEERELSSHIQISVILKEKSDAK
jgi:hypothetical protein